MAAADRQGENGVIDKLWVTGWTLGSEDLSRVVSEGGRETSETDRKGQELRKCLAISLRLAHMQYAIERSLVLVEISRTD